MENNFQLYFDNKWYQINQSEIPRDVGSGGLEEWKGSDHLAS